MYAFFRERVGLYFPLSKAVWTKNTRQTARLRAQICVCWLHNGAFQAASKD